MIKKIKSSEIKSFIANNSNVELLDVRTQQEWDNVGKPDGEKLGLKTHFITISRGPDGKINKSFLEKIKKNTNCILSPHVAGVTEESNKRVSEFIANTVKEFFNL